jgi:hypothetical protein
MLSNEPGGDGGLENFQPVVESPVTKESIIDQTYFAKISPHPSFAKRGIPPFCKGRAGGI